MVRRGKVLQKMKYIRIKNDGLIEPQALHLVGASTKRNDNTKIGQFGSGNKYALAYLLRNGYDVKIFAGLQEIVIDTKPETFRDNEFNVIYINGERTSITTEMGKDWEFWQALREIYSNAMDEKGHSMDFLSAINPVDGETHFYIGTKKDVMEFVSNFDNYFATNKKVLFECPYGKILEKSGDKANVYRKGIRCFTTNKNSIFDYDFTDISIDENRLVKYFWQIDEKVWDLIYRCTDKEVVMQVLHNSHNHEFIEGCISDVSSINGTVASEQFKECIKSINLAPKGMAGMLKPDEIETHVIVPTKVFSSFRGILGDENVGDKFKVTKFGGMFREIDSTLLYDAILLQAVDFLKECNFEIPYLISIAIFDNKDVLGSAHDGKIILSDICMERGINEVVNTILEEFIHLKYDVKDETRAFQTATITEFISYMKKINSFAI